jgi:dipeptidyl aminopeptidase/acylaminoacyl peptidase
MFSLGKKNQRDTQTALEAITSSLSQPEPFTDLTIPSLRSRQYQSDLKELALEEDHLTYTSYLTSYTSDGLKINGLITVPKGDQPEGGWPAIVFVHGYIPPTQYQTTQKYLDYVDYLARSGFVVFKIDLRGHGESEGDPGGAYYSSDYVIDTLNAYAALQKADFVNPQAIGLWGHSMAGNVVLRAAVVQKTIPATVIWAGAGYSYEDLQKYRLNDQSYRPATQSAQRQRRRDELFAQYGQFSPESPFWKEVAPTNFLSDLTGAVQLHHAENDAVVSLEYSRDLDAALDQTTVPHEFFMYPSGGHNLTDPSFSVAMQRTVTFFHEYLR